ncbi:histidine kinase [Cytophagales bacterium LB-30]|uniref:Histidine kinase n=1 Tax=Shiella aurantiaca TaxID=3058365 RepID=A0ABT8F7A6_9BACT|nr:histidine kinase [Shiella aurantiaca]MDN4166265.1 histidine kinase [Shiella aurantiaca]
MMKTQLKQKKVLSKRHLSNDEVEEILIYFSTSILEKEAEQDVFWDLVKNVIARLGFVDCVIYKINKRTRKLVQRAAHGPKNPKRKKILKPLEIPLGSGITGFVATTGVAERIGDTRLDPRYIIDDEERRSELAVPIIINNKVVGVIDCEHPMKDYFTEQDFRIVKAIASICAIKLKQLEAQKAVQQKEYKLLQTRQQLAELKVQAIRAQMNPHFVFNALNAVQHFITINDKKNALRFLSAFSKLVRLYLKNLEKDTIDLFQEIAVVEQYLKLQKLRYEGIFEYEITLPEDEPSSIQVPALIVQLMIEEAVENLAKNRLAGKLRISIALPSEHHVAVIVDIAIRQSGKILTKLETRYTNEVANWADHINLLKKVREYSITTSKEVIQNKDITHYRTQVLLPIL